MKHVVLRLAVLAALAAPFAAHAESQPKHAVKTPSSAPVEQPDPGEAVDKASEWLNSAKSMIADFVQIGQDGRRAEGKLYVARPGRLRFEYAQPATMEIVADGTSVVVKDRKLHTQDEYFIKQTPLKFLLKDEIDLRRDVKLLGVKGEKKGVVIAIEDKATFGGTSRIKLIFDPKTYALKQWQVTDPQGYETMVSLYNIDLSRRPDNSLFKINHERMLNPN
ncbi:MAG: outer-membrane lipoprotein carrier protein LolA [Hyphomicrobiales bacterium]|nr:outer-membrane lipoprotein carrier protein LolA [Hyphomicrobiales bacterium]